MFDSALWVVLPGDPESCPKSPRSTASRAALNPGSDPFARYTSPWTTGPTRPRAPGGCATRRGTWNRSDAAPRLLPPSSSTLEPPAFVKGTREEPHRAPSIVAATLELPPAVRTSPPPCEPLALADVGEFLHAHFVAVSHSGLCAVTFARSKADIEMAAEGSWATTTSTRGARAARTDRDSCPELRDAELDILDSHAVPPGRLLLHGRGGTDVHLVSPACLQPCAAGTQALVLLGCSRAHLSLRGPELHALPHHGLIELHRTRPRAVQARVNNHPAVTRANWITISLHKIYGLSWYGVVRERED
ncbi:hypothetical protein T492DRAFT_840572 [Pavlovales sp. CCMP2436]|nr:hypothetical protein T492DRAFT_840572 [Pavlovales sp. CCMP2436]